MSVSKRFKLFRKTAHVSQAELATFLSVSQPTISDIEHGIINPNLSILQLISNRYHVSLEWLILGTGEMFRYPEGSVQTLWENIEKESDNSFVSMAVAGEISCGVPLEIPDEIQEKFININREWITSSPDNYLLFIANGKSMEPEVCHSDFVLIEKTTDWVVCNEKICAVNIDGEMTLKRIKLNKNEKKITLQALNPDYHSIEILADSWTDIRLVGRVKTIIRRYL